MTSEELRAKARAIYARRRPDQTAPIKEDAELMVEALMDEVNALREMVRVTRESYNEARAAHARTDVPALIARVRELEAECAKWKTAFENIRRTNTNLMMELFEAQEKARTINIGPVLHENEQLRSHARAVSNLLAIIHGDGGHYEGKHGTVKACKDAEGVVSDLRLKLDAATYALGEKP